MARRNRKLNWFDKLFLGFILFGIIMVPIGAIIGAIADGNAAQYHTTFQHSVDSYIADGTQVRGNKAVSIVTKRDRQQEPTYSDQYIPEQYTAEHPEEVRFLVHCVEGESVVGYYSGGGVGTRLLLEVTVEDLKTDEILGERTFFGGYPPETISVKPGKTESHSGSAPSESDIKAWVRSILEGALPMEYTEAEDMQLPETEATVQPPVDGEEALKKVEQVMLLGNRSYSAVVQALEEAGFTQQGARYAVDHCGVDWKEEALSAAEPSLRVGISLQRLTTRLELEKFTQEEIDYVLISGVDWMEQAVLAAKYQVNNDGISYVEMIERLQAHGFTDEEAVYGADHCEADWKEEALQTAESCMEGLATYGNQTSFTRAEIESHLIDVCKFTKEEAAYAVTSCGLK